MHFRLLFLLFLLAGLRSAAQADSVLFSADQPDGIFLSYYDFRHNHYIAKEDVVSDLNKDQLEFLGKVMYQENFSYRSNGNVLSASTRNAWGFFQNKTLYVNFKGDFYRVPVFGSICYLVATVTVINSGFYDPMFGYGATSTRSKEIREFMMSFYDGVVTEFSLDRAEELLSRDKDLYTEYNSLSRRRKREQVNRFIRRFNELHPVYFLK